VSQKSYPHPWLRKSSLLDNIVTFPKALAHVASERKERGNALLRNSIRDAMPARADSSNNAGADRYLLSLPNSVNQYAPDIWWLKAAALGASWQLILPPVIALCLCALAAGIRVRRWA
jgi:hypothetical protein